MRPRHRASSWQVLSAGRHADTAWHAVERSTRERLAGRSGGPGSTALRWLASPRPSGRHGCSATSGCSIAPGELHGLVGQNGCGKSTLVKILTGIYTPDPGGAITVDGRALSLPVRPLEARAAGLSVVHQNLGLVDDRTVWENVRLGRFKAAGRFTRRIDGKAERAAVEAVFARLGAQRRRQREGRRAVRGGPRGGRDRARHAGPRAGRRADHLRRVHPRDGQGRPAAGSSTWSGR